MSLRALQTNTVSFGLVNIPVRVYSANNTSEKISFNQLHAEKKTRLKQQMYDPETGEIVAKEQIVKGYEYAKDQYVTFTEEELAVLDEEYDKRMDIAEFVPAESVDPLYLDTIYFMGPDKGAERAFRLFLAALKETKREAVVRYASRGRQHVALIRPLGDVLALQQLRYADEVRSPSEVEVPAADVKPNELALAVQLVAANAGGPFDPKKYSNNHREKLAALIESKLKGDTIVSKPKAAVAPVGDLMAALSASLKPAAPAKKKAKG